MGVGKVFVPYRAQARLAAQIPEQQLRVVRFHPTHVQPHCWHYGGWLQARRPRAQLLHQHMSRHESPHYVSFPPRSGDVRREFKAATFLKVRRARRTANLELFQQRRFAGFVEPKNEQAQLFLPPNILPQPIKQREHAKELLPRRSVA